MMAKGNYIGKILAAALAAAVAWIVTPGPKGMFYAATPDNAQMYLDYRSETWFSPPCLQAGKVEAATQGRLETYADRAEKNPERWAGEIGLAVAGIGLETMADAHAMRKKSQTWRPDDACNAAGGLTNRALRWTPDGQWRW